MKKLLRTYFYFSKSERKGVWILFTICLTMALLPRIVSFFQPDKPVDFTDFEQAIALLHPPPEQQAIFTGTALEPILFAFDPNTVSFDSLQLLGLSSKVAQTIVNYREKGGRFYQKEDLRKIYGLSLSTFQQLAPWMDIAPRASSTGKRSTNKEAFATVELFPFDPNTIDEASLVMLGLPERVINTLLRYREKGGRFYEKDDLQKIYGLSKTQFRQLAPYIIIPPSPTSPKPIVFSIPDSTSNTSAPVLEERIRIDINQATPEEWQRLKGIGPSYARRITTFREKLGGFTSIRQVASTYYFPDSVFQQIKPCLDLSPIFRPIDLNQIDQQTLAAHPYLNYRQANAIIRFREQHGRYTAVEEIRQIGAIDTTTFQQVYPYLKVK